MPHNKKGMSAINIAPVVVYHKQKVFAMNILFFTCICEQCQKQTITQLKLYINQLSSVVIQNVSHNWRK